MSTGLAATASATMDAALEPLGRLGALVELLGDPRYQAVVLGSSKDPNAKVTVLLLSSDPNRPSLAVKVPTTELAARAVAAEAELLAGLHRGGNDAILTTVPKPLGLVESDGRPALAIEVLPGAPMATVYHSWRHTARPRAVAADFAAAATWLARFQQATAAGVWALTDAARLAVGLKNRFGNEPGPASGLDPGLDALAAIDERLSGQTVPACAVHGDYWFGNLLVDGPGGPVRGVVDWEAGALSGSPLRDLARFPIAYALYLDRHTRPGRTVAGHRGLRAGQWGAGLLFALGPGNWFGGLFRRFLAGGLDRLGVRGIDSTDLALLGIAEAAVAADHPEFARQHLEALCRIARTRT